MRRRRRPAGGRARAARCGGPGTLPGPFQSADLDDVAVVAHPLGLGVRRHERVRERGAELEPEHPAPAAGERQQRAEVGAEVLRPPHPAACVATGGVGEDAVAGAIPAASTSATSATTTSARDRCRRPRRRRREVGPGDVRGRRVALDGEDVQAGPDEGDRVRADAAAEVDHPAYAGVDEALRVQVGHLGPGGLLEPVAGEPQRRRPRRRTSSAPGGAASPGSAPPPRGRGRTGPAAGCRRRASPGRPRPPPPPARRRSARTAARPSPLRLLTPRRRPESGHSGRLSSAARGARSDHFPAEWGAAGPAASDQDAADREGRSRRRARGRTGRPPARITSVPSTAIIAPLSVHSPGRGVRSVIPAAAGPLGEQRPEPAVGGHAAADQQVLRARSRRRRRRPWRSARRRPPPGSSRRRRPAGRLARRAPASRPSARPRS